MTLRQRVALHYGAVLVVALSLVAGLTYHEVATERRLRKLIGDTDESEVQRRKVFDVVVFSMIPFVLFAGWWFTRRSLLPISNLAKTVERIQPHTLREPIPRTHNGDEVDRLTEVFNSMTARLHESFQQIREFTLHASHELKTPLTVMRAQLETRLQNAKSLSPEDLAWLESELNEVNRLSQIVDSLTLLAKGEAGQLKLERKPVRLDELVRESFEDAQIMAEPQGVKVTLGDCEAVEISGDRDRLRQLLLNLTDNAVKYNRPGGSVSIALRRRNGTAEVEIINTGEGIPPELQARIFERFVRGDEARSRAIEGCGLGLTICRWIVQSHAGTIELSTDAGKKTTALVRLPIA
ncbi:MAG: HAMP domain-containing histidine kinase [Verrucomicrobiales bacterium]|nr:HAMP domain-containing histidine kinase [Verrucomicrobiales bacterium]